MAASSGRRRFAGTFAAVGRLHGFMTRSTTEPYCKFYRPIPRSREITPEIELIGLSRRYGSVGFRNTDEPLGRTNRPKHASAYELHLVQNEILTCRSLLAG